MIEITFSTRNSLTITHFDLSTKDLQKRADRYLLRLSFSFWRHGLDGAELSFFFNSSGITSAYDTRHDPIVINMRKPTIKRETLSTRCEICHQSDLFDPVHNYCSRCNNITRAVAQVEIENSAINKNNGYKTGDTILGLAVLGLLTTGAISLIIAINSLSIVALLVSAITFGVLLHYIMKK